jgi:hypothetical protein
MSCVKSGLVEVANRGVFKKSYAEYPWKRMVGSAVGKILLSLGNQVIFYDLDCRKVEQLRDQELSATLDLQEAASRSVIPFI